MDTLPRFLTLYKAHWLGASQFGELLLIETAGQETEKLVELITRWVLLGSFLLIAAGDWLPDYDDLLYSVYQYTNHYNELVDRMRVMRARTCFQFLDLLLEANRENKPVLILDFLHHFYNPDVMLDVRDRIFEECCQSTKRLSLSTPVAVLVEVLDIEDYRRFFPLLASVATEIIPVAKVSEKEISQGTLF